jgi:hypothetical protein
MSGKDEASEISCGRNKNNDLSIFSCGRTLFALELLYQAKKHTRIPHIIHPYGPYSMVNGLDASGFDGGSGDTGGGLPVTTPSGGTVASPNGTPVRTASADNPQRLINAVMETATGFLSALQRSIENDTAVSGGTYVLWENPGNPHDYEKYFTTLLDTARQYYEASACSLERFRVQATGHPSIRSNQSGIRGNVADYIRDYILKDIDDPYKSILEELLKNYVF